MELQPCRVVRSKRHTITLEIAPDGSLTVRVPLATPKSFIDRVIAEKAAWITAKQRQVREAYRRYPEKNYTEGENFPFLGAEYRLFFAQGIRAPRLEGECLLLPETCRQATKDAITRWYRARALEVVSQRAALYARRNGLSYKSVKVTGAKKRWGSCGPGNTLNFSWHLVKAPLHVVDYVVIHELAHTVHHNHSKAFWSKVLEMMPDCREQKQWLAENSGLLK